MLLEERLLLVVAMVTVTNGNLATNPTKPPNVVILLADDLGMGDVGCYGNDTIRTPNIDRLAREGVKLSHHLAAASVCTPSRAAFLTGRYPIRSGMVPTSQVRVSLFVAGTSGLPTHEITFPEILRDKGYSTGLVGKWHLGLSCWEFGDHCHHPVNHGFQFFYGLPLTNLKDFGDDGQTVFEARFPALRLILMGVGVGAMGVAWVLWRGGIMGGRRSVCLGVLILSSLLSFFLFYTNLKIMNSVLMRDEKIVEQPIRLYDNLTNRLVNESVTFMKQHHQDETPFLLFVSFVQVHVALHASARFRGNSAHGHYGDEVEELDWSVGQILDALDTLGLHGNTLVYFSSDNGGHRDEESLLDGAREGGWNGIYRGGKTQGGMEGGIRVPTVMRWPGVLPGEITLDQPTSQMDLLPTLAHITGAPVPDDRYIDGRNILPLLSGGSSRPEQRVLLHYCGTEIHAARISSETTDDVWKFLFATPRWKAGTETCVTGFVCDCYGNAVVRHNPPLLYNVAKDPGETLPLDTRTDEHNALLLQVNEFITDHQRELRENPVENQFAWRRILPLPWLQPCCNFPYCNCTDPVYP